MACGFHRGRHADKVRNMRDRNLFAIVLAAGRATRFGSTKQLQPVRGTALVACATALAEGACGRRTVLVTGNAWRDVAAACAPLQGFFVVNSDFERGLSTSVAAGVNAVRHCADAVLLLLADQPLIDPAHLRSMIRQWQGHPDQVVASGFADTAGPPAIFPRRCFEALLTLQGDTGARRLLQREAGDVRIIDCPAAAVDIDEPGDLDALY